MEKELQVKHLTKRKMKTKIRKSVFELRRTVNNIIFNAIMYLLDIVIKSLAKAKRKCHQKKLLKVISYSKVIW